MPMTSRVARLRQESLDARPTLSAERASLLTDFYQGQHALVSAPMLRAQAFAYLMEHKMVVINPGELIVGEKGPAPKARADLPRALLPLPGRPGHPQLPRKDIVRRQPDRAPALRRENHSLLAGQKPA